jgi:glycosyltransferase involved in cell wall biosynthesis
MNYPLRVLFISSDASAVSGVGRCIADLVTHLDRSAIEPILVTAWPSPHEDTIVDEVRNAGVPVYHRTLGIWFPPLSGWGLRHLAGFLRTFRARTWALAHLIREHRIDVVYSNALPSPDAAITARQLGIPHVWHLHEAVCGNQYLRPYLPCLATKHLIHRLSTRIITVSHQKAAAFAVDYKQQGVRVVHNGVDLDRFVSDKFAPRPMLDALGLSADTRLVVLVGIVSAHKGHDTLVRAAARLLRDMPNTAFLLVGNELDGFGEALRQQIGVLGIAAQVFFLGPRNDVAAILRQVDLLVLPSTQEALPLVLLEAMATALPVVATRCGGPEEIVVEGETGYLVQVGDDAALAECMRTLLADADLAERMGAAGRRRVEAEFSLAAYARNIQNVIAEAYATAPPPRRDH